MFVPTRPLLVHALYAKDDCRHYGEPLDLVTINGMSYCSIYLGIDSGTGATVPPLASHSDPARPYVPVDSVPSGAVIEADVDASVARLNALQPSFISADLGKDTGPPLSVCPGFTVRDDEDSAGPGHKFEMLGLWRYDGTKILCPTSF